MIASYIAANYPVERLVLLSASAYYLNPIQIVQDVRGWFLEGLRGELLDDKLYHFYRKKVKQTPLWATKEFSLMVRKLRGHLKNIKVPTLIIQGECDGLVPPRKSAEFIYEQIQSEEKRLYFFPNAKHYIWFGEEKEALLERINEFLCIDTEKCDD